MDAHFEDPGYLVIGDFTLHDNESEATGYGNPDEGVRTYIEQRRLRPDRSEDGRRHLPRLSGSLGDGRAARCSAAGTTLTASPRSPRSFRASSPQMGFGQGALLMTPLQMALVGAAIANGGDEPDGLYRPPGDQRRRLPELVRARNARKPGIARYRREGYANDDRRGGAGNRDPGAIAARERRREDRNRDESARSLARMVRRLRPSAGSTRRSLRRRRERRVRRDVRGAHRARSAPRRAR